MGNSASLSVEETNRIQIDTKRNNKQLLSL